MYTRHLLIRQAFPDKSETGSIQRRLTGTPSFSKSLFTS